MYKNLSKIYPKNRQIYLSIPIFDSVSSFMAGMCTPQFMSFLIFQKFCRLFLNFSNLT